MSLTRFFTINEAFLRTQNLPKRLGRLIYLLFRYENNPDKVDTLVRQFINRQMDIGGFPIISENRLTFCYYGKLHPPLAIEMNVDSDTPSVLTFTQVGDTSFYYATTSIPEDAELIYRFISFADNQQRIAFSDPLNPLVRFFDCEESMDPHVSVVSLTKKDHPYARIIPHLFHAAHPRVFSKKNYIYLPPSYFTNPTKRYPVIYMHDGQNIFDYVPSQREKGWEVNLSIHQMIQNHEIEEAIIVGIPHAPGKHRLAELTPSLSTQNDGLLGHGPLYADFVLLLIKPFIDRHYRTLPDPKHTYVCGSSLGGLISIWMAFTYPDIVGNVGCMSPSFWFEGYQGDNIINMIQTKGKFPLRIYMDTGTGGISQDGLPYTRDVRRELIKAGWTINKDFFYLEEEGAIHNEEAWRKRFPHFLRYLLKNSMY